MVTTRPHDPSKNPKDAAIGLVAPDPSGSTRSIVGHPNGAVTMTVLAPPTGKGTGS